jgi:23S rRNA-intervening sequence protein
MFILRVNEFHFRILPKKNMLNFKKMKFWEASLELVELIYKTSLKLPSEELYGISDQIKRASVPISSNIV